MSKRDTHFANFAQLLARELTQAHVFYETTGIGQKIIAQRAYDLVRHVIYCNNIDSHYWPGKPLYGEASDLYERETTIATDDIPDLTEWHPTKQGE